MKEDILDRVTVLKTEELPDGRVLYFVDTLKDGVSGVPRFAVYEKKGKDFYFAFGSNDKQKTLAIYQSTIGAHREKIAKAGNKF